jgi:hypothetical protein
MQNWLEGLQGEIGFSYCYLGLLASFFACVFLKNWAWWFEMHVMVEHKNVDDKSFRVTMWIDHLLLLFWCQKTTYYLVIYHS